MVKGRNVRQRKLDIERRQVLIELPQRAGSDDGRSNDRPPLDPCESDRRRGRAQVVCGLSQLVDERVVFLGEGPDHLFAPISLRRPPCVLAGVLARERAAVKWTPWGHPQAEFLSHRYQFPLHSSLKKRVLDLQANERGPSPELRDGLCRCHFPGGGLRAADVAYLARGHHAVNRPHPLSAMRPLFLLSPP